MSERLDREWLSEVWSTFAHDLHDHVRAAQRAAGLSGQEIADRLGEDPDFIDKVLQAEVRLTLRTIRLMVDILCATGYRFVPIIKELGPPVFETPSPPEAP